MKSKLIGERWVTSDEKRALDILIAGSLVPVTLPIGATALAASRLMDGPTPLVYQERIGQRGEPFLVKKIRSMQPIKPGREVHRTDSQITPLGKAIRPFTIDEIPQLWNIIDGTMSVVGPRAYPQETMEGMEANLARPLYEEWLDVYYTSRPGGLSTYNIGTRLGKGIKSAHEEKARMDIADFRNASLSHDLKLIKTAAKTGLILIGRKIRANPE